MKYLTTLLIWLVFFSCQSGRNDSKEVNKKTSTVSLRSEILAIHDEVMPKMGELRKTKKNLMIWADSLKKSDSTGAATLLITADEIASANEGMMDWMRNYEPAYEGTEEEVLSYLEEQKKSIQRVKENMESSLTNGRRVAATYSKRQTKIE